MDDEIRVTLAANAGVLLSFRGRKLLIDGLFRAEGTPFSSLPPATVKKLMDGQPPYDGIDYLLFTHGHPDHFSPDLTRSYLKRRGARGVLLPPGQDGSLTKLRDEISAMGIPCLIADGAGGAEARLAPDLRIRSIPTRHLDKKYHDVPHVVLLMTLGEKRLLFTGDADYVGETFDGLPPLRAVFLNPLFFHACCTGRFFRGFFRTENYCVCHIPFPEDDVLRLRELPERDRDLHPPAGCSVFILNRPDQQVLL